MKKRKTSEGHQNGGNLRITKQYEEIKMLKMKKTAAAATMSEIIHLISTEKEPGIATIPRIHTILKITDTETNCLKEATIMDKDSLVTIKEDTSISISQTRTAKTGTVIVAEIYIQTTITMVEIITNVITLTTVTQQYQL